MADVGKVSSNFSSVQRPVSAYHAVRDEKTGTVKVLYDDKHMIDEETIYEFNADGSATSRSCAWGVKTELPAGTFSDLMLSLPKAGELSSEIAQQMVVTYLEAQKQNDRYYYPTCALIA